jgi:hypothetical protein
MSDDSGDEPFAFWSKGELTRIAVILSVGLLPVTLPALDTALDVSGSAAQRARNADLVKPQPGRLRSVKIVDFTLSKFGAEAMGDGEN